MPYSAKPDGAAGGTSSVYFSERRQRLERGFTPAQSLVIRVTGRLKRLFSPLRKVWTGDVLPAGRRVVYVHFDRNGDVHDYTIGQLRAFAELGYATTFVTNSDTFSDEQVIKVRPFCASIIWRSNEGYDFAAYRDGILSIPAGDLTQLILTNDSCYGPLFPLASLLDRCDPEKADVWGATDSRQIAYHLQSYFLLFHSKALHSAAFRRFWRRYPNVNNKAWVILNGEIGISHKMSRAGLRLAAAYSCDDAETRLNNAVNDYRHAGSFVAYAGQMKGRADALSPVTVYWETLIAREHFPFLKRSVLTENPKLYFADRAIPLIAATTQYDATLISRHLDALGISAYNPSIDTHQADVEEKSAQNGGR
jgi:lipopolysaccharide biosynthesis protein